MKVRTDRDINGITAKWLRERAREPQIKFWGSVGVSQPTGSQYENGTRAIPRSVQALLFVKFEAGLTHDTGTIEGAQGLREFAAQAAITRETL